MRKQYYTVMKSLSLSFRLWIPQVRGQPHGLHSNEMNWLIKGQKTSNEINSMKYNDSHNNLKSTTSVRVLTQGETVTATTHHYDKLHTKTLKHRQRPTSLIVTGEIYTDLSASHCLPTTHTHIIPHSVRDTAVSQLSLYRHLTTELKQQKTRWSTILSS